MVSSFEVDWMQMALLTKRCVIDMLASTSDGRLFLKLEDVLGARHGINPLALEHSSETRSSNERDALL
jgi:hypothetical protein